MRQVIKHRDIRLLKMIRRTDPVIRQGILKYFDERNGSDNFSKKLLKMIHKLKNNDFLNSLNINPIPD